MEIDDREEGRLSTVEVPVGDTGKGRACVWKLGIDDNCKLILMIDRWLTLRFVIAG